MCLKGEDVCVAYFNWDFPDRCNKLLSQLSHKVGAEFKTANKLVLGKRQGAACH